VISHIPLPTLWLCNDHYRQSCARAGYELPILPAFNVLHQTCDAAECTATADVLITDVETLLLRESEKDNNILDVLRQPERKPK
jgi:hypothetical protein